MQYWNQSQLIKDDHSPPVGPIRSLLNSRLLQRMRNSFEHEARIFWSLSEQTPTNLPPVYTWPIAAEPSVVTNDDVGRVLSVSGTVTEAGGDVG